MFNTFNEFQWSTELKVALLIIIGILFTICIFLLVIEIRRKIIVHTFICNEDDKVNSNNGVSE